MSAPTDGIFGCPSPWRRGARGEALTGGRRFDSARGEVTLGLYYYDTRWYDPALGRFIQVDTSVPDAGDVLASHACMAERYAYVKNNPLRYVYPTGHATCEEMPWECDEGGNWAGPQIHGEVNNCFPIGNCFKSDAEFSLFLGTFDFGARRRLIIRASTWFAMKRACRSDATLRRQQNMSRKIRALSIFIIVPGLWVMAGCNTISPVELSTREQAWTEFIGARDFGSDVAMLYDPERQFEYSRDTQTYRFDIGLEIASKRQIAFYDFGSITAYAYTDPGEEWRQIAGPQDVSTQSPRPYSVLSEQFNFSGPIAAARHDVFLLLLSRELEDVEELRLLFTGYVYRNGAISNTAVYSYIDIPLPP